MITNKSIELKLVGQVAIQRLYRMRNDSFARNELKKWIQILRVFTN